METEHPTAEFLGGPRDGECIEVMNTILFEPILSLPTYVVADKDTHAIDLRPLRIREYHLARRYDGQFFYIAQPMR